MVRSRLAAALTASVNSAVVHCTLQGFIARLVVRADKGRRVVWTYQVHGSYNATHDTSSASSFATRGYLLTLTVGKVGTRRLGVADCTELVVRSWRVSSITRFRQLRRVPLIAQPLHPSRSQTGSTGNPDGIGPSLASLPLETYHLSLNHVHDYM